MRLNLRDTDNGRRTVRPNLRELGKVHLDCALHLRLCARPRPASRKGDIGCDSNVGIPRTGDSYGVPDGRKSQTFTVVLLRVDGGLHLGNQFAARRGEVGCNNSQLDRAAAVPHRVDLDTANTCNGVDLLAVVGHVAAERFTVNAGVVFLAQRVGRVAVFSGDKYSRNRCGIQTVHRLDRQQQAGVLVADRTERFGLQLVVTRRYLFCDGVVHLIAVEPQARGQLHAGRGEHTLDNSSRFTLNGYTAFLTAQHKVLERRRINKCFIHHDVQFHVAFDQFCGCRCKRIVDNAALALIDRIRHGFQHTVHNVVKRHFVRVSSDHAASPPNSNSLSTSPSVVVTVNFTSRLRLPLVNENCSTESTRSSAMSASSIALATLACRYGVMV